MKGKVKEGLGKLSGDSDLEAEGQMEQGEGKARQEIGKAGRAVSDLADRAKDKLSGDD